MIEKLKLDKQQVDDSLPTREEMDAILDFHASPEEIIDHYFRHDPLLERELGDYALLVEDSGCVNNEYYITRLKQRFVYNPAVAEHAAIAILASVVTPQSAQATSINYIENFIKNKNDIIENNIPGIGNERAIAYFCSKIEDISEPSVADLSRLGIAVDYISIALGGYSETLQYFLDARAASNEPLDIDSKIDLIASKVDTCLSAIESISPFISRKALDEQYADNEEVLDLGMRFGLFSTLGFASLGLQLSRQDSNIEESVKADMPLILKDAIKIIRSRYFTLPIEQKNVVKGSSKGSLHEALWSLDMNFILMQNWNVMPYTHSAPVLRCVDMPKIGYPNLKRGFDQVIMIDSDNPSASLNRRTIPVQLKSSKSNMSDDQYHPSISVVAEENFQDVDLRRLDAKLKAYEQWIEYDMQQDEYADRVMKYTLKSSRDFIETVKSVYDMTDSEYFIWKYCAGEKVDRHRRRRIERRLAKMALQKQKLLI